MIFPKRNTITDIKQLKIGNDKRNQRISLKPNGFWYSCGDDWYNWIKREKMTKYLHKYIQQININNNVMTDIRNKDKNKLLIIKNVKDFDIFNKRYGKLQDYLLPIIDNFVMINQYIDWIKVSKDYGGIEICPYFISRNNYVWYNSWDVASGCIWNTKAIIKNSELIYEKKKGKYVKTNA